MVGSIAIHSAFVVHMPGRPELVLLTALVVAVELLELAVELAVDCAELDACELLLASLDDELLLPPCDDELPLGMPPWPPSPVMPATPPSSSSSNSPSPPVAHAVTTAMAEKKTTAALREVSFMAMTPYKYPTTPALRKTYKHPP